MTRFRLIQNLAEKMRALDPSLGVLGVAVTLTMISFSQARACPAFVRDLHSQYLPKDIPSLCVAVDRYQAAVAKLESKNVKPAARMADLLAIRMINTPTWQQVRKSSHFDPWSVYQPAPLTWDKWENGASIIDQETAKNFREEHVPALTKDFLMTIHQAALEGLSPESGEYRQRTELGRAWNHQSALTKSQAEALVNFEHRTLKDKKVSLISWHPTQCFEDRDSEFQKWYVAQPYTDLTKWPEIDPHQYYVENGHRKQCGYLLYAAIEEVQPQYDLWLKYLNPILTSWGTRHTHGDPLLTASTAARWFIGIHPYVSGNGRTSRFAVEHILKSLGLPSPILVNMDYDVVTTEKDWAMEIGRGIRRAILVAENCAKNPSIGGCNVVPTTPQTAITPDNTSAGVLAQP